MRVREGGSERLTNLHYPLFDRALDDVSRDVDWLVLAQPMHTVYSLLFDRLVPPCIHHKHVCGCQYRIERRGGEGKGRVETRGTYGSPWSGSTLHHQPSTK